MKKDLLLKLFSLSIISAFTLTSCYQAEIPLQNIESLVDINSQKGSGKVVVNDTIIGTVTEILPDDNDGTPHQIFMIKISSKRFENKVAKIVHNTDIAPRVPVKVGVVVEIKGDIIVNEDPIVIHWTHKTLGNSDHPHGYIKVGGKTYE